MNKHQLSLSVDEAVLQIKSFLSEKGFDIFADINHRGNATSVGLELPSSRLLLFGNPLAGTKLMQKDICASFDLPMRVAIVDEGGETYLLHNSSSDYVREHRLEGHPVLEKIDDLFAALTAHLS